MMMKFNTFIKSKEDIDKILTSPISEVLIEPKELARLGSIDINECMDLCQYAKKHNMRTVLVWDILMTEDIMLKKISHIQQIDLNRFDAVRILDLGAGYWLKNNYPHIPIHIMAENQHNIWALQKLYHSLSTQIERLVLSLEIPAKKLKKIIQSLPCETEIQGLGRILLYHTPRKLYQTVLNVSYKEAIISSEYSANKNFPTFENQHGFFMFHSKDNYLLDKTTQLQEMQLSWLRLESRFEGIDQIIQQLISNLDKKTKKDLWPRPTFLGFYNANKTDSYFKKFHNPYLISRDELVIGEIIQSLPSKHLILEQIRPFIDKHITFITPEGKVIHEKVNNIALLSSSKNNNLFKLVRLPWKKGVSIHSLVFQGHLTEIMH